MQTNRGQKKGQVESTSRNAGPLENEKNGGGGVS